MNILLIGFFHFSFQNEFVKSFYNAEAWIQSERTQLKNGTRPSVVRPTRSTPQALDAEKAKMNMFKTLWSTIMLLQIFSTDTLTYLKVV